MLQIDLSRLSVHELNRLVESTQARGQDTLTRQLRSELQARRAAARGGEPDALPLEAPMWTGASIPDGDEDMYDADEAPRPRRGALALVASGAVAVIAAALGWGLTLQAPQPAPRAMVARVTAPAPALPAPAPAIETPAPAATPAPDIVEAAAPAVVKAAAATRAAPAAADPAKHNACLDLPTPGERLVCGYPSLASQDRRLIAAYDRAVAAGVENRIIDREQNDWLNARNRISDRAVLGDLYEQRIRDLEVAEEQARNAPPF